MPISRHTVCTRILAHRRHEDPIPELQILESERRKESRSQFRVPFVQMNVEIVQHKATAVQPERQIAEFLSVVSREKIGYD